MSPRLWQAALAGSGIAIAALTLSLYHSAEPTFPPTSRPTLSPQETDRQIASARSRLIAHPEDFNAWTAIAMAYFQKGPDYYVDAMNALEKARALGATNEHLFFYAGVMYDVLGLPDYAVNELTKYLHHHPDDYETMVRLANVYFRQKRYDDAEALYRQALHEWPKDPTAWFNFAVVNRDKGNYAAALRCMQQVRQMTGGLPDGGYYEEGMIYHLKGEEARALGDYQLELTRNPNHLASLEAVAQTARSKGDLKQARNLRKRLAALKNQARYAAK